MWILPKNHPLSSQFAPEAVASKKDLQRLLDANPALPLMWRSKPSSAKTWLARWKRVYWIQHLFTRTLQPSVAKDFEAKYTESLAVIPAKAKAMPENACCGKTPDSFGHILNDCSAQQTLFSDTSKTSADTLQDLSPTYLQAYEIWATALRQDFLQRKKLAESKERESLLQTLIQLQTSIDGSHTNDSESSSLLLNWNTPNVMDTLPPHSAQAAQHQITKNRQGRKQPATLREQVDPTVTAEYMKNWSTPQSRDYKAPDMPESGNMKRKLEAGYSIDLNSQVKLTNWPTATVSDNHTANLKSTQQKTGSMHSVTLPQAVMKSWPTVRASEWKGCGPKGSQSHTHMMNKEYLCAMVEDLQSPDQDGRNTGGKNRAQLNPAWVLQLMGTTLEKTFFAWRAMPLCHSNQNTPSGTSTTKSSENNKAA